MATLVDYAHEQFPNHNVHSSAPARELADHTVVGQVLGTGRVRVLEDRAKQTLTAAEVGTVYVEPTDPTVVPSGGEDRQAVVDLPKKRVAASTALAGVAVGVAAGLIVGFVSGSVIFGIIIGLFGVGIGAVIGGMLGGGGRYAGERAWQNPNAPDTTIALIAAYCSDEAAALVAARQFESLGIDDVRVLGSDGGWHLPNT